MNSSPTRVVLNFSNRCALNCEWCYVSFGSVRAHREIVESVVDRVADLGFRVLTFGGGDPFQYSFIASVAERAKKCGLFVHIDTHAKSLRKSVENRSMLLNSVDLLGLPLDGSSAIVHDSMRGAPGHFSLVVDRIKWLNEIGVPFKINTMISRVNYEALPSMACLVSEVNPVRWSIYQYMPLGPAGRVSAKHQLDDADFEFSIKMLDRLIGAGFSVPVEVSNKYSRRQTYPIVQHDGTVSVHSGTDEGSMESVCSIFDAAARDVIDSICGSERESASSRY